jgi:PKD repeat protein
MAAWTDKPLYEPGEVFSVTVQAEDESGPGTPIPLTVRLSGTGIESSRPFTLTGSAEVVLTGTVGYRDELLSYGLYATTGRSLLLDTLRLRVRGDEIGLYTDKGVYRGGETVTIVADAAISGTLSLSAPGLETEREIGAGQTAIPFTLPGDLTAGTYRVDYAFNDREGSYRFEVDGLHVSIAEVILGEQSYTAQDTVAATLQLMSNQDLPGASVEWQVLDPQGEVLTATHTSVDLVAGRTPVTLDPLAFQTARAGTHALYFQVGDGSRQLASGAELFDVTGPTLLGLHASRAGYRPGQTVEVVVSTLGAGEATLQVWLDGALFDTRALSLDGYGRTTVDLGDLLAGDHPLTVELSGDGLASREATTIVVRALPQVSLDVPIPNGTNGWYKSSRPHVDLRASEAGAAVLYHWDGAADVYDLGLPIVPAEGEHTLYAHAVGSDGAVGPEVARTFLVDTAPPETQAEIAGTQHPDGRYSSPITVTLAAGDATSGVAWSAYRLGESSWLYYTQPVVLSASGTYTLAHRSMDVAGNEEQVQVQVVMIEIDDGPTAALTGYPLTGDEPLTVAFADSSSGDIDTRVWQFGDGETASDTLTPTHVYGDDGVYTVTLTVADGAASSSDTLSVVVNNVAPVADAGPDRTVDEGTPITMTGSFQDPGVLDTHTIAWDFGDGSTGEGTLTPVHTYPGGVYTATLTVTDDDGGVGSDVARIVVLPNTQFESFRIKQAAFHWLWPRGNRAFYRLEGDLALPDGYTLDDLTRDLQLTFSIKGKSVSDTVSMERHGNAWIFHRHTCPACFEEGMRITRVVTWHRPGSAKVHFALYGDFSIDAVNRYTRPAEATINLGLNVVEDRGADQITGEQEVSFIARNRLWYYRRHRWCWWK